MRRAAVIPQMVHSVCKQIQINDKIALSAACLHITAVLLTELGIVSTFGGLYIDVSDLICMHIVKAGCWSGISQ